MSNSANEGIVSHITGSLPKEVQADADLASRRDTTMSNSSFTSTAHPYTEIKHFSGGARPVIRGTRILVSTIIRYLQMGETPETIIEKILPHLSMVQIQDAILYYAENKEDIARELRENTEEFARCLLKTDLGEDKYRDLTGA